MSDKWKNSTLIQLKKDGNGVSDLNSIRHIHVKEEVPKLFQQIVTLAAKDKLFENMSKFQLATKPGHRATEHVFVIFSLMTHLEKEKKAAIISQYDLSKYFDREDAHDICNEVYKSEIRGRIYRLMFMLNKSTRITVKTPVGETKPALTGPLFSQGSIMSAIVSSVNIDSGVRDEFHKNEEEDPNENETKNEDTVMMYDEVKLYPLLFQDDLSNVSESIEAAQTSNDKMEHVINSKQLDFNLNKSSCMIIGHKNARKSLSDKMKDKPLTLCNVPMKCVMEEKYLGIRIAATVSDSITATVNSRIGLATRGIYEVRAIIEDSRADVLGAIQVGMNLWNLKILPMVLWGCETWYNIPLKAMKKLEKQINQFLKSLLGVGKNGCPIPSLYLETASLKISNQILLKKLLFYYHIATLPEESLAGEFFSIQNDENKSYRGIVTECNKVLKE